MLHGSLDRRGIWGRIDTCIHKAESLSFLPETIAATVITLLIAYTEVQNKKA